MPDLIRPATLADASQIAKLGAHVFAATFGHSVPASELQAHLEKTYTPTAIARELQDPQKDIHVATDKQGNILGFAVLARGTTKACTKDVEDSVELQRVYVDTAAHGNGVGWMLAKSIEERVRGEGFRNIWLSVWEENHSAHKAYGKWGYRRIGDDDFVVGTVIQRDYIMMKAI